MIRTPAGVCIPLNPDYSRHGCYLPKQEREKQEIQAILHAKWIVQKTNQGLKHHKITIKIEQEERITTNVYDTNELQQEECIL